MRSRAAVALLWLAACSGDTAGVETPSVASVQVEAAAPQVLPGASVQLSATARDAAGNAMAGQPMAWSSEHAALATVDGAGRVLGIAPGQATIVARSGEASGRLVVTVLPHPVASVTVSPDTATLAPGASRTLAAVAKDAGGNALSGRAVSWTTTHPAVATVDAEGRVTAHAEGTAGIRAASEGVQSAPVAVTVRAPIAALTIEPAAARLVVGQKRAFAVTARDLTGRVLAGRQVTVSTSAPSVVGLVGDSLHALTSGTATITARAEGITATAEVTVVPKVAYVTVSPDTATLAPGATRQLAATVKDAVFSTLAGRTVSWHTTNAAVATVDAEGRVTAHAEGTAGIRAASEGVQSAPAAITVHVPIATLAIEPATARLAVGQKLAFAVTARDPAGRVLSGRAVTVSTSAPAVVGLVGDTLHALAAGTATVTARAEGKTAALEVTVLPPVASVTVSPGTATLAPAATRQLSAIVRDAGGAVLSGRTVSWLTTNPAVATVDAGGRVTAHAEGTAAIRAVSEGVQSAPAAVTVRIPIASLSIQPAAFELTVGQKQAFAVVARDGIGRVLAGRAVTVTSSAPGVAAVLGDSVRAVAPGTATLTARAEGYTATAQVAVAPVTTPVGGIINTDTRWTLDRSPYRLTAAVQVAYGATLTIDPGVTVLGAGQRLEVWGALHAVGTQAQPIQLSDTHLVGRGVSGKPFTLRLERLVMDRGSLYQPTGFGAYGSMALRHSVLRDLASYLYVWYPVADVFIEGNRFVRSGGISVGAFASDARVYVRNNAFVDWTGGFAVENWASYAGEVMVVERNSFLGAGTALRLPTGYTSARLNAPNNWWGTTDEAVIRSMILDNTDDLGAAGPIEFRPFLTAPHPDTP